MKLLALALSALLGLVASDCGGDNCANHVTGTWGGIGVSLASRISLCNKFLHTTIKPHAITVTATITKYTTDVPHIASATRAPRNITSNAKAHDETLLQAAVPTFASAQCPKAGQFSSACHCWAQVTARTTTLRIPTVTATATQYLNIGCSPASTGASSRDVFPCSGWWGMCACLQSGGAANEACVRVGDFFGQRPGHGANTTGPCRQAKECDADSACEHSGDICVFDGSCGCGKRRCYTAAPEGCDYQGLPMDDIKRKHF